MSIETEFLHDVEIKKNKNKAEKEIYPDQKVPAELLPWADTESGEEGGMIDTPEERERSQEYREIFSGDIWVRYGDNHTGKKDDIIEARHTGNIYFLGEEKYIGVSELGLDLKVIEGEDVDTLATESSIKERKLEDFRRELRSQGFVRKKKGHRSEYSEQRQEVSASSFTHIPSGEVAHYVRTKQDIFDDSGRSVVSVERAERPLTKKGTPVDGYLITEFRKPATNEPAWKKTFQKLTRKDRTSISSEFVPYDKIMSVASDENWQKYDEADTIPASQGENIPTPPKLFQIKKEVIPKYTRQRLLDEIVPGDRLEIRSAKTNGPREYRREGDAFVDKFGDDDTDNIIGLLNGGWRLVEHPENNFMAGRETRQFLSDDGSEDGAQYTVAKKSDGYYVRKDRVWTPQLVRDENVFAGFRNSKLQDEDDWQGPLTKVQMLEQIRAEYWEPVVEINSLKDFLREGGPEAALRVKAFEEIFADEWQEFQESLKGMSKKSTPVQMTELQGLWKKVMLPQIESMMTEDLMEHGGLLEEQAQRVVADLSAEVSLLKR